MKKPLLVLFLALGTSLYTLCRAQEETVLYSFTGANGNAPFGSLIHAGNRFYGMTKLGGINGGGNIFSIDSAGNNYKDLWDFQYGNVLNAAYPYGSLLLVGHKLYGTTEAGGADGSGCIFSIDTNGTSFTDMWDFVYGATANGSYPYGNLILLGSEFYGTASFGGINNKGCIFRIDSNGNGYTNLVSFTGVTGTAPGTYPHGSLTLSPSGSILYGVTQDGGANNDGVIFSVDTNGLNYKDLFDFSGTNGSEPAGSLLLANGVLYGTTTVGGAHSDGSLFSIDTNGNNFKDMFDFSGLNGKGPYGDVILWGSQLFGMAEYNGASGAGVIFSIDTNGTGYKDRFDFNTFDGDNPSGSFLLSGSSLYAMTSQGGLDNEGVVFKFDTNTPSTASVQNIRANIGSVTVYPNPSNGAFTLRVESEKLKVESGSIEIYNVLGEQVYSNHQIIKSSNYQIDLSSQPGGVYLYKVIGDNGNLVGEGKLIIQK